MGAWEADNQEKCSRIQDEGAFFGFDGVGRGNLAKATRLLFVPAVRDAAADAQHGKGSVIAELVDVLVRRSLADREDFKILAENVRTMHRDLLSGDGSSGVQSLGDRLSSKLRTYVPDASVQVRWEPTQIELPLPRASVRVAEDGFLTSVAACGHGLQRAFIMSLLQELAMVQPSAAAQQTDQNTVGEQNEVTSSTSDLVLVIEEPELFQHPSRQRHLSELLARLASEDGAPAGTRIQVVYCTHSPHFVGVDRFDQLRLFRRMASSDPSLPKESTVTSATIQSVAERIAQAKGETGPVNGTALRARLTPIMTPSTSEGFFADVAVLVEGDGDRAAILGAAELMGVDFEGSGIAVIPCSGKTNVLTVAALFSEVGIVTYCVWDGDADKGKTEGNCEKCGTRLDKRSDPKENHALLRFVGEAPEDFPTLTVANTFACFNSNLEDTLKSEIGSVLFEEVLAEVKHEYGMTRRNSAIKNPRVLAEVLRRAAAAGGRSSTVESIVNRIVASRIASALVDASSV